MVCLLGCDVAPESAIIGGFSAAVACVVGLHGARLHVVLLVLGFM